MRLLFTAAIICLFHLAAFCQQPGTIKKVQKISATSGNLGSINAHQGFGSFVVSLGDINNDGLDEIAVGGTRGDEYGSVFIISLNKDGTVSSKMEIGKNKGGFTGDIQSQGLFGSSVANIGDLDADGVPDIAIGESSYNSDIGRVWIVFLNSNCSVKLSVEITNKKNGFNGLLKSGDLFGSSIANVGDLNKDGINDIAVGAMGTSSGGAVWILFLNSDGTINHASALNNSAPGLKDKISSFGSSICNLRDYNNDGITDIAVGDKSNNENGNTKGAIFLVSINSSGTILQLKKISDSQGGFSGYLQDLELFGSSITCLGDIDGDSIPDIGIGAIGKVYGSNFDHCGEAYVITLKSDGTVKNTVLVDTSTIGIHNGDRFGWSSGIIKDLDGDRVPEYAIGAIGVSDGGDYNGALYICFLNGIPQISSVREASQRFQTVDIYPNPNAGEFTLHVPEGSALPHKIEVYDLTGQLMYMQDLSASGSAYVRITPGSLAPGTYILRTSGSNSEWHERIIVR